MPSADSRERNVLVVDDSPAIRARMEAYLRHLGFKKIRTAGSLNEALEAFKADPADVVFLDMVIDEERGVDFAAEALESRPFTYIVLMTALPSSNEQVTASIAEGARDYLSKPINLSSLQAVVERAERDMAFGHPTGDREVQDRSYV